MQFETATILLAFFGLSSASPIPEARVGGKYTPPTPPTRMLRGREVPQEHSHEQFITTVRASLNLNNPDKIQDPIFGLLGNAAASVGQGSITNTDCLHQATADQAFSNAKAAGDIPGMTAALVFATLERNTGAVGQASVLCTAITAVNPEIAALSQHQDPASTGAAATNKAITLELAKQIASVGGDPQTALKSGTFAPGTIGDPTGAGNTCDNDDDPVGCIFTQNLLVEDATAAEIDAAVAGVAVGATPASAASTTAEPAAAATTAATGEAASACPAQSTVTVTAATAAATSAVAVAPVVAAPAAAPTEAAATTPAATTGANVQTFTGALGGIAAPEVIESAGNRPFSVAGNTFVNKAGALQRSCAIQHNKCSDAANAGTLAGGQAQCETQEKDCNAAA